MATGTAILPIPAIFDDTVPPGMEFQNSVPVLLFDDTVDEVCYWRFKVPADYNSAPVLKIAYSMASATANEVIIGAELWSNADGENSFRVSNSEIKRVFTQPANHRAFGNHRKSQVF